MTMLRRKPVEIVIDNVYTRITGKYPRLKLDEELSFYVDGYFHTTLYRRKIWDGKEHLLEGNLFPTGLLPIVEDFLLSKSIKYTTIDIRKPIITPTSVSKLAGVKLRPYQTLTVAKTIQALRGVIEIPTGGGKTLIAAAIIKSLNVATAFLVHKRTLVSQSKEVFESQFPDVGVVAGGKRDWGRLTIFSVGTLLRMIEKGDVSRLRAFRSLFIDECHHVASVQWGKRSAVFKEHGRQASWYITQKYFTQAYARIGLSATPIFKKKGMLLTAATGPLIHTIPTKELQDQDYLSEADVKFVEINDPACWMASYAEAYDQAVIGNDRRNEYAVKKAIKYAQAGKFVMIFVRIIDHGEIIKYLVENLCRAKGIRDLDFLFVTGQDRDAVVEEARQLARGRKLSILLVTQQLFGEGVDIPSIDVLINLAGGRSATTFRQVFGRGLRKEVQKDRLIYIDFFDATNRHLRTHSNARILQCRKMSQKVEKVTLDADLFSL
jgi:superfamily II DNA or RNA helicase